MEVDQLVSPQDINWNIIFIRIDVHDRCRLQFSNGFDMQIRRCQLNELFADDMKRDPTLTACFFGTLSNFRPNLVIAKDNWLDNILYKIFRDSYNVSHFQSSVLSIETETDKR